MAAFPKSPNFPFFEGHDAHLHRLAAHAEYLCFDHPDLCLTRLRQLAEAMAMEAAVATGGLPQSETSPDLLSVLRLLDQRKVMSRDTADVFHLLRRLGNEAVHHQAGTRSEALRALKLAQRAAVWFHRTTMDPAFRQPAFVAPPAPADAAPDLRQELAAVQKERDAALSEKDTASARAQELEERSRRAEEDARRAYADLAACRI